jgi:polyisoprenoid-binding protein YceI
MKFINTLALTTLLTLSSLYATDYKVDSSHSDVGFKVKHMMISSVKGSFEKFSGTFSFDEKKKHFSNINGVVEVASITTKDQKRDKHLKSTDFFNAEKYPKMIIKLIKQSGNEASIELTIKDVTKTITMSIEEINGPIKDPWGNVRSAFELHGEINRKAFNIKFHKLLETGGLLVGDTIKLNIVIEGIQIK